MQMMLGTVLQPQSFWAPIVLLVIVALLFAVATLVASITVGRKRNGPVKDGIYEAGMVPIDDTRQRFNARFYVVAMIFIVFDVEIVFLYPWATLFPVASGAMQALLLAELFIFVFILLTAYVYAWGKGVFRWA